MVSRATKVLATVGAVGIGVLAWDFAQSANSCGSADDPDFQASMGEQLEGFEKSFLVAANYFEAGDHVEFYDNMDQQDGEPVMIAVQTMRDSDEVCLKYNFE